RYTPSNSPRPVSRASRGKLSRPASLGRKAMASLLAARRQHFAAAHRFHPRAEPVGLRPPPSPRLKCALWHSNPPSLSLQPIPPVVLEFSSVFDPHSQGQGIGQSANDPNSGWED